MNYRALSDMIAYYHNEPWVAHTLKVFGYAQGIAAGENLAGEELEALEYAALFHDVGIPEGLKQEGSSAGPVQERLGAPIAMALAKPYVSSPAVLERVGYLVGHHHSFEIRGQRDLQILFEADWLVNLVESAEKYNRDLVYDRFFVTETGRRFFRCALRGEEA
ncbi:MAG: HD domain-containing protein [Candidatus Spyradocola sp.]|jgi:uncharacterized protein